MVADRAVFGSATAEPKLFIQRFGECAGLGAPAVFGLLLWLSAGAANAQEFTPRDVAGWTADAAAAEGVELPPPPTDFVTESRGGTEWTFPASATAVVRDLQAEHAEAWARVLDDLGAQVDDRVTIRVALDPEQMRELAPIGHPPPDYAAGVAYPHLGVILLSLSAPETWERPDLEKVLVHELSHVALHRAVGGRPLPRWFVEGVAIHQAKENDIDRIRTLWHASVSGNVIPLAEIDRRFPRYPHRVSIAYAQSADIISHLRRDDRDARRFRRLVSELAEGVPFEDALLAAYDATLPTLEREWRARLDERFHTLPLVVSGGGLWTLASLLLIVAWRRRRKKHKETLARWAREEAAEDRALARAERAVEERLAPTPPPIPTGTYILVHPGDPPQGREPGVPTVEHDGRSHTLH